MLGTHATGSEIYSSRSSAYRESLCFIPFLLIPVIEVDVRCLIDRGSIASANRRGLRGHPCMDHTSEKNSTSEHINLFFCYILIFQKFMCFHYLFFFFIKQVNGNMAIDKPASIFLSGSTLYILTERNNPKLLAL